VTASRFYLTQEAAMVAPQRRPTGAGHALPSGLRSALEPRFGHDFRRVRVHSDGEAAASARSLGVPAYSVGTDIVLGEAARGSDSAGSQRLIAHELAHVVQREREGPTAGEASLEEDATRAGERAAAGSRAEVGARASAGHLLCAPPGMAQPPRLPGVGWKAPEMWPQWYTLDGFETKQAELTQRHRAVIDDVVKDLAREPLMGGFITIIGHADAIGPTPENKMLGQQRADAVRAALIDKGVSADDVRAYSLGEEILKVETQKAEAKNRRVEIVVRRRHMGFGMAPAAPSPRLGPRASVGGRGQLPNREPILPPSKSEREQANERVKEFERRMRQIAYEKGAPKDAPFDELVKYLARQADKDVANRLADAAASVGVDRKWAKEKIEQGLEKGIEAGLKGALNAILEAIAGPPTEPPTSQTGPAELPWPKPTIIPVPLPFPGDAPAPANIHNPTLTVTDRVSASMTKTVYKPGDFVSFRFTTPESYGQVRAVVEIVPAGGGAAVRTLAVTGRRSGNESFQVPDTAGSYVLQLRLADEQPHPRGAFRFSVRELDPAEKK
jgi:outer membrane protein OmpA-like peptidoglycan-associated protein